MCVYIMALSSLTVAVQFVLKSGKYKLFYLFKIVLIIDYMYIKSCHLSISARNNDNNNNNIILNS